MIIDGIQDILVVFGSQILLYVTFVALGTGAAYGIRYLRNKLGAEKFALLQDLSVQAVRFAEQVGILRGLDTNADKKEFVMNEVAALAKKFNIPVTETMIDLAVEAAVYFVKHEDNPPTDEEPVG
jgi:hypothetical protein